MTYLPPVVALLIAILTGVYAIQTSGSARKTAWASSAVQEGGP